MLISYQCILSLLSPGSGTGGTIVGDLTANLYPIPYIFLNIYCLITCTVMSNRPSRAFDLYSYNGVKLIGAFDNMHHGMSKSTLLPYSGKFTKGFIFKNFENIPASIFKNIFLKYLAIAISIP